MDWSSVFDEAFPVTGATDTTIEQFIAEIASPLSAVEVIEGNAGQRNPFPPSDRLHPTWQRFDASRWVIPVRPRTCRYCVGPMEVSSATESDGSSSSRPSTRGMECGR